MHSCTSTDDGTDQQPYSILVQLYSIQGAGCGWRGLAHTTVVAFPTAHVLARGKGAGAPGEVTEAAVDDADSTG